MFKYLVAALALFALVGCWTPEQTESGVVKIVGEGGHGSGVLIGPRTILTAAHVATATQGTFTLEDTKGNVLIGKDNQPLKGTFVTMGQGEYDFAIMRLEEDLPSKPLHLSCWTPKVGQRFTMVGFPMGAGITYSEGRVASEHPYGKHDVATIIQGAVVGGMSGGPVLDSKGDVIGITVAQLLQPLQMGPFPMPSSSGFGFVVSGRAICDAIGRE